MIIGVDKEGNEISLMDVLVQSRIIVAKNWKHPLNIKC